MIDAPWNDRLAEPLAREHLVQLYRDDSVLVEAVALFAGRGLGKGESVVVVATEAHRAKVLERLRSGGFDVADLEQWGQLTMIDAGRLLSRVHLDGVMDAGTFRRILGDVISTARSAGRYRRVRVYGEIVNLLWKVDHAAARRLEELWNETIHDHGVSLLCAYRVDEDDDAERRFPDDLRALHSHLIPVRAGA
jgi:KaiC/GvpD/RAD55 family RecA-like ATPase